MSCKTECSSGSSVYKPHCPGFYQEYTRYHIHVSKTKPGYSKNLMLIVAWQRPGTKHSKFPYIPENPGTEETLQLKLIHAGVKDSLTFFVKMPLPSPGTGACRSPCP